MDKNKWKRTTVQDVCNKSPFPNSPLYQIDVERLAYIFDLFLQECGWEIQTHQGEEVKFVPTCPIKYAKWKKNV